MGGGGGIWWEAMSICVSMVVPDTCRLTGLRRFLQANIARFCLRLPTAAVNMSVPLPLPYTSADLTPGCPSPAIAIASAEEPYVYSSNVLSTNVHLGDAISYRQTPHNLSSATHLILPDHPRVHLRQIPAVLIVIHSLPSLTLDELIANYPSLHGFDP